MDVTPIVVTHNSEQVIGECLQHLRAVMGPAALVVVDNASSDRTCDIASTVAGVRVLRLGTNLGFGTACNRGIALARTEWVLLVNPDVRVDRFSEGAFRSAAHSLQLAALAGRTIDEVSDSPYLRPFPGVLWPGLHLAWAPVVPRRCVSALSGLNSPAGHRTLWASGALLALRREAFHAVGGFDEDFFLYFEDTDLSRRLWAAGWIVGGTHSISGSHVSGLSSPWASGERQAWGAAGWLTYVNKWHGLGAARKARAFLRANAAVAWLLLSLLAHIPHTRARGVEAKLAGLFVLKNALRGIPPSVGDLQPGTLVGRAVSRQLEARR